jgi:hypothetical protein
MLDLSKYRRFFAFGCSFTSYKTPTWADIVAKEMPNAEYYNFGQGGGGNLFINNRVAQANLKYSFNEHDLVMIMFTTVCREDRFLNGRWESHGNVFNQSFYSKEFVKNYCDPVGYLVRDAALIEMTTGYVTNLPCTTKFLSMVDLSLEAGLLTETASINSDRAAVTKIKKIYRDKMKFPAVINNGEVSFKGVELIDKFGKLFKDGHPLADDYAEFLHSINFPITERGLSYVEEAMTKLKNAKTWDDVRASFPDIRQHQEYRNRSVI